MSEANQEREEQKENPSELYEKKDKKFIQFLGSSPLVKKLDSSKKKKAMENQSIKNNDTEFLKALEFAYQQFGLNDQEEQKTFEINNKTAATPAHNADQQQEEEENFRDARLFDSDGEKPNEQEIGEEFYQKYIDEFRNQLSTQLEKTILREAATQHAKLFCLQFELQERNNRISDLTTEKTNLTKQLQEIQKENVVLEGNSKKQEQKIMRLEKAHRENEELYKTIKHLLTINITEIEESAINKAKKLLRDAEAHHLNQLQQYQQQFQQQSQQQNFVINEEDLRPKSSIVRNKGKNQTMAVTKARPPTAGTLINFNRNNSDNTTQVASSNVESQIAKNNSKGRNTSKTMIQNLQSPKEGNQASFKKIAALDSKTTGTTQMPKLGNQKTK